MLVYQFVCALLVVTCMSEQRNKACSAHLEEDNGDLSLVQKRGSRVKPGALEAKQEPLTNTSNSSNISSASNASSSANASSWDAATLGNEDCKCIGIKLIGEVPIPAGNDSVMYPADVGSRCEAWEQDRYPGCVGVEDPPDWCLSKWCYVDPCKCKLAVPPKQSGTPFTFQNKTLYWSYATCGAIDAFSEGVENACVNQLESDSCTKLDSCAWDGKQCLGKDLVGACRNPDLDNATYGKSTCRCIGFAGRDDGYVNLTYPAPIGMVKYPGSTGGSCQPWEALSQYPDCQKADAPEWCQSKWCYVDPCSCTGLDNMPTQSSRGATYQGKPVYWSYGTCGGIDIPPTDQILSFPPDYCPPPPPTAPPTSNASNATNVSTASNTSNATTAVNTTAVNATIASNATAPLTVAANVSAAAAPAANATAATSAAAPDDPAAAAAPDDPAAAAAPEDPAAAEAVATADNATIEPVGDDTSSMAISDMGSADCECIGVDMDGISPVVIDNLTVNYPLSAGSSCKAWDSDIFPGCLDDNPPDWCAAKWCYVDPCKCNLPVPPKKSITAGTWQGKSLYWSYATCGEEDSFSATNPDACVNQQTEDICMGLDGCAWDGEKCLGRELVEDCQLADAMPETDFGVKTCRCVGWGKQGSVNITFGGKSAIYPASLGGNCSAWDDNRYPDCQNETSPDWCKQKWCYVDPCDCTLPSSQPKQSSTEALYKGRPVYWSYGTCGGTDTFTVDLAALPAFPPDFCNAEVIAEGTTSDGVGDTAATRSEASMQAPLAGLAMLAVTMLSQL